MGNPLVSVWMVTYNHEKFIAKALESVLMQKTSFGFEIVIGEDCSTDRTRSIIESYVSRFGEIIKPIYQTNNVGAFRNAYEFALPLCNGKYIACLEGDDYWTDPLKLQKQVDFLEANPEFIFSFHDAMILNQRTGEKHIRIGTGKIDEIIDLKSVILQKNISTASYVFRNILDYKSLPDWFCRISNGDYGLAVLIAEKGPGKFLPEVMSVYRIHDGGVWSSKGLDFYYQADLIFYNYLLKYFTDTDIQKVILAKLRWRSYNHGITEIRNGRFLKGGIILVRNLQFNSDKRVKTNLCKIPGALKSGLIYLLKKSKIAQALL